jgi:hypothetical protein
MANVSCTGIGAPTLPSWIAFARPEATLKVLGLIVILIVVAVSLIALLNWSTIAAPTPISLGFTTVQAPLGMVMLVAAGILTATFFAVIVYQQATALVESRRAAKDLHAQRELADRAEASRFTELRAHLDGELRGLGDRAAAGDAKLEARLGELERRIAEVANGLSADVGELDDKLDRVLQGRAG